MMAGPIAHIVFALNIFSLLPPTINKEEFLIGTSFPDIRYLAELPRETTHIEPISWLDVIHEPSSFRAGMLFHNLVDILRMQYFEPYFFDRFCQPQCSSIYWKLYPLILKMAEDAVLYTQINHWQEIISYFDDIIDEERNICTRDALIKEWHTLLQHYFSYKPTIASIVDLLSSENLALLHSQELNIEKIFKDFLNNKNFVSKLIEFYQSFISLLPETPISTPTNKNHLHASFISSVYDSSYPSMHLGSLTTWPTLSNTGRISHPERS